MSQDIKNLIRTKGWKEIETMVNEVITECRNQAIPDDMPANEYKINAMGNKLAAHKLKVLLNKIKLAGGIENSNKVSWK